MKPTYKTSRKYKCPFCDKTDIRSKLVDHVENKHHDVIPENYTAARSVYDSINKKDYGTCMICGNKVYSWNDKINRYRNLCDRPECRAKVRETALKRHIKVYGKPTLLNDADQQQKMLSQRRISGSYTFTDGVKVTYTGKYERNALEFMDKVLEIPSKDIQAPGPTLEYEYNGEKHKWITDIYYIPANLIIEVKDGGSNPNNRTMTSYRDKQVAKEVMVTNFGKFNYVRLTDNNFAQLLEVFADIKNGALSEDNPNMKIHINEEVGGLPPHRAPEAYIVPYAMDNAFTNTIGLAYMDSDIDRPVSVNSDGIIEPLAEDLINESTPILLYKGSDAKEKINKIHEMIQKGNAVNKFAFAEVLTGSKFISWDQILLNESFVYYDKDRESKICHIIENAYTMGPSIMDNVDVISTNKNVSICRDQKGYYAKTTGGFNTASDYFNTLEDLESSGVIDLMNNIYTSNIDKGGDIND